jgi:hypothetical protein
MNPSDTLRERNAIIESAELTTADHGLLSGWLTLNYGGAAQGFGGHALFLPASFTHSQRQGNICGLWIWRVLEAAGVERWSELVGKTIRVRCHHSGVEAIGHIVRDDLWFNPTEQFAALLAEVPNEPK